MFEGKTDMEIKLSEQVQASNGIMDFSSMVKAGGENIKWLIIGFDEYAGNICDGIQSSYNYLTKNHSAKGKV